MAMKAEQTFKAFPELGIRMVHSRFDAVLGDGNNAAGARKLDSFRENIRRHKRGGKVNLPPRSKPLESYFRG